MLARIMLEITFWNCDLDLDIDHCEEEKLLQKIKKVIPEATALQEVGLWTCDIELKIDLCSCSSLYIPGKAIKKVKKILKAKAYGISVI